MIRIGLTPGRVLSVASFLLLTLSPHAASQNPLPAQSQIAPLIRLLQSKGILTDSDVARINALSTTSAASPEQLAQLLLAKGIISRSDYEQMFTGSTLTAVSSPSLGLTAMPIATPAVYRVPDGLSPSLVFPKETPSPSPLPPQPDSTRPAVIPAITPLRVLPVGGLSHEGLKPAFSIGAIHVTPYGFIKATAIHDSSSAGGDDFPLPGFISDTGPGGAPEFHVKARSSRIGSNFEWLDPSSNLTVTGKIEVDFEGNFTRADNRNLSAIRSSTPSIRLAYGRLDYKLGQKDTVSALFGQDWTPFGSSTLPNLLETTIIGGGFGSLWERDPQMRFGWTHDFDSFQLMPELAVVLPASGDVPSAANLACQLGYGERQGPDSARPTIEGRVVGQFQLDHASGVAPAQIIFSGEQGERKAIVLASAVPAPFKAAFPTGTTVTSSTDGWTGEFQLPTRYATLIGKYYDGSDLRWFFGGQFYSSYNDIFGLTNVGTAPSTDGASNVAFGTNAQGVAVVAPQRPVRASGGFANIGLPLSRIFGADPQGRNMGWSLYLHYGVDFAKARDVDRFNEIGARHKSPLYAATLYYKLNNWVTFAFEQSLYQTYALPGPDAPYLPLFNGTPSPAWRDLRSEGGTIFTF
jgi:hypothetical protein